MNVSGTTTNSYATIMDGAYGGDPLLIIGGIKNNHALNVINIKLTVTNSFEETGEVDTILLTGNDIWNFDSFTESLLGVDPPYKNMKVEVKSALLNAHAGYNIVVTGSGI